MSGFKKTIIGLTAAGMVAFGASSAQAANVVQQWDLFNHPDGGASPPPYGLRLDNIFGASGVWTFSFEDVDNDGTPDAAIGNPFTNTSTVTMTLFDDDSLNINGQVFGGKTNSGSGYTAGGLWNLDFTYTNVTVTGDASSDFVPVQVDTGTDGLGTLTALSNAGTIVTAGEFLDIRGKTGNPTPGFAFAYVPGTDAGARCNLGSSADDAICDDRSVGEGWLQVRENGLGDFRDPGTADFLFTGSATAVPLPASAFFMIAGLAGLGALRMRRAA